MWQQLPGTQLVQEFLLTQDETLRDNKFDLIYNMISTRISILRIIIISLTDVRESVQIDRSPAKGDILIALCLIFHKIIVTK